jgi:hypothetical protein
MSKPRKLKKENIVCDICDLMELRKLANWFLDKFAYDPDGGIYPYRLEEIFPDIDFNELLTFGNVMATLSERIESYIAEKLGVQDDEM